MGTRIRYYAIRLVITAAQQPVDPSDLADARNDLRNEAAALVDVHNALLYGDAARDLKGSLYVSAERQSFMFGQGCLRTATPCRPDTDPYYPQTNNGFDAMVKAYSTMARRAPPPARRGDGSITTAANARGLSCLAGPLLTALRAPAPQTPAGAAPGGRPPQHPQRQQRALHVHLRRAPIDARRSSAVIVSTHLSSFSPPCFSLRPNVPRGNPVVTRRSPPTAPACPPVSARWACRTSSTPSPRPSRCTTVNQCSRRRTPPSCRSPSSPCSSWERSSSSRSSSSRGWRGPSTRRSASPNVRAAPPGEPSQAAPRPAPARCGAP